MRWLAALCVVCCLSCKDKPNPGSEQTENKPPAPTEDEPAAGEPKPPDKPTRERKISPADYSEHLAAGRKHINAGEAEKAAAEFRRALEARPGDPTALSELSWAAFKAGDLKAAREAATESIANAANDPHIQAMSLYNRGRVAEAEKDKDGAIADYSQSYVLRPHPLVRQRIEALGAPVPESVWRGTDLEGPYPDIETFCSTALSVTQSDRHAASEQWCGADLSPVEGVPELSWAGSIESFEHYLEGHDYYLPVIALALHSPKGIYVLRDFAMRGNRHAWTIDRIEVVAERLVVYSSYEEGRFEWERGRFVTVCGVGPSERPSCFGPTSLFYSMTGYEGGKEDGHELPEDVHYHCEAKVLGADRMAITATDGGCRSRSGFQGEHTLVFP